MTAEGATKVLIVDDHPIVREGLRAAFKNEPDFDVIGEARDGAEAIAKIAERRPDVVLMDLRMPGMDGVTAIRRLLETDEHLAILVLTTFDSDADVLPAVEAGAVGYLLKDAPTAELLDSVRAAAEGKSVLAPSLVGRLMGQVRKPVPGTLSKRELEVLELVAHGASNREVASRLFVSEASIKTHLVHIFNKLGVRDRAGAVGEAYRRNLFDDDRT